MNDLVKFLQARLDEDHERGSGDAQYSNIDAVAEYGRRMVREVEAKRRILDEHFGFLYPSGNPDRACRRCSDRRTDDDPLVHDDRWLRLEPAPCPTLRLLALPYADHPNYQQEWKP